LAGFREPETTVAEHLAQQMSFHDALASGVLDRRSSTQLLVISDREWESGLALLHREEPE
jgi:hypothetical protein